ncbi:RNB-domain-containing protein [Coprinellus micaceus]|uniref:RNB-domain-containing protein n=1 Tax=Coprinellus micaceus TaxID=71717 RepID=A0A4Y7SYW6_COPMI|nr:RNB-domain-containing protein [Coprinellus micaceus]
MLRQGARPALAHTQNIARQCRRSTSSGIWSTASSLPPSEGSRSASRASEPNSDNRKARRALKREHRFKKAPRTWGRLGEPETEARLRDMIQTKAHSLQSAEKETFLMDRFEAESESPSGLEDVEILPGSFIATRRNNITTLGIALGSEFQAGREAIAMFTPTGEVWYPFHDDVTFVLPAFISSNLTARCGLGEVPGNDKELSARMEVLKRLRELVHKLESQSAGRYLDSDIWKKFRANDPNAWGEIAVGDVARMISEKPQFDTIFAAHLFLMDDPLHFVAKHPYLITQTFNVRPQTEVQLISKVLQWKREDDKRLTRFAAKAKPIIAKNSQRIKESAMSSPTYEEPEKTPWNEDDKTILRFLQLSLRQTRSNQADPFLIARAAIMRMLDPTHPLFTEADVARLLVNLGVFSPWQDLLAIQYPNTEPEYDPASPVLARQERIAERSLLHRPQSGAPIGPEDFYSSDPLEPVRHDFGDLPVFVIDEPTAKELDDGVSIEPIPSEPGSYWLHAHIANPTATLPPTHILAIDALKQGETQYWQHHTVPLFPTSIVQHPDLGWSLGTQKGEPTKTITFSGKINGDGDLVDYKVRAGLINNVRVVTYDAANKILGYDPVASNNLRRPIGGPKVNVVEVVEVPELAKKELDDLQALHKVAQTIQANWCRTYVAHPSTDQAAVTYGDFPSGSMTPSLGGRTYEGFPEFRDFVVRSADSSQKGSMGIVQEVMRVAGRVGSMFALEHKLPMIRRALAPPVFLDQALKEELQAIRTPAGTVPSWRAVTNMAGVYAPQYTFSPDEHFHVGARAGEGYSRMTSPLRRALDLVGHWQLHRALLGKHADSPKPMFDVDWLDQFRVNFGITEGMWRKLSKNHTAFWVAQFLDKWMKGEVRGEGFVPYDPDKVYYGHTMTKGWPMWHQTGRAYTVEVPELGVVGSLQTSLATDFRFGTKVSMKLSRIDLKLKPVFEFSLADSEANYAQPFTP